MHSDSSDTPTVLVLDDEPFVRNAARRFLKGSGYACVEAETVDGAIELLRRTPVIAAMLDMRLPDGRTGIDVLTQLRKVPEFRDIPVMIVTGSILTDTEKATTAKLRGFVFFQARRILYDCEFSRPPDGTGSKRVNRVQQVR